ncbi:hypothetical protein OK016_12815 [Vibrio chagasii]|nr:hypothetical protein [Vibrio chagasii]
MPQALFNEAKRFTSAVAQKRDGAWFVDVDKSNQSMTPGHVALAMMCHWRLLSALSERDGQRAKIGRYGGDEFVKRSSLF